MPLKSSKDKDELCYPFIYEQSCLCDYEIATDEMCSRIGMILSILSSSQKEVANDLETLQPLIYHLNGSLRGKLAISEDNQQWLLNRYHYYQDKTKSCVAGFVLPRGSQVAMQLHLARSLAKKAIRLMVSVDQEGITVPDILHRFCNLLCNFFFVLAIYINHQQGFKEKPFTSKSYRNTAK
jgi:ATP:cob(I)alamin adenosyltransferase